MQCGTRLFATPVPFKWIAIFAVSVTSALLCMYSNLYSGTTPVAWSEMSYSTDAQRPAVLQQLKAMGTSNGGGEFYHFFPVSETGSEAGEVVQPDNGDSSWGTDSVPSQGYTRGPQLLQSSEAASSGDFHFFPVSQPTINDDAYGAQTEGGLPSSASASPWSALQTALDGPRTSSNGVDEDGQVDQDGQARGAEGDGEPPAAEGGGGGYDDDDADDPAEAALLRASHISQGPHLLPIPGGRGRWLPSGDGLEGNRAAAAATARLDADMTWPKMVDSSVRWEKQPRKVGLPGMQVWQAGHASGGLRR